MKLDHARCGATAMTLMRVAGDGGPADPHVWADLPDRTAEPMARHGAVLVRGLGITTPEQFHGVVSLFDEPLDSYRGGNTPRTSVSPGVFTSTEYPAQYEISLHNELSYAHRWPRRLYFCCLVAPGTGGATPVCDGRALLAELEAPVRDRFESLGVLYRQHLHGGHGFGKSWQQTFETDQPGVAEAFLREAGAEFVWTAAGDLRVGQRRPGVRNHPVTGQAVWFNQAEQWHPSNLPDDEAEALLALVDGEGGLPHSVAYGDGTPISLEDLMAVRAAAAAHRLAVPWQPGDLMIIDNMLVLHGREPFTGERRVVVAMT